MIGWGAFLGPRRILSGFRSPLASWLSPTANRQPLTASTYCLPTFAPLHRSTAPICTFARHRPNRHPLTANRLSPNFILHPLPFILHLLLTP